MFLPGERDIREASETLTGRRLHHTEIIPLLASLPASEQQRAFRLSQNRRIILSTNVAETSVTLPGIRYVIDSGLVRFSRYNARTQVQRLQIEFVSQASANQRQGRCGRIAPGICIRLYNQESFNQWEKFTPPEILRASLAGVILTMLDLRLGSIESFPFIDPPSATMIREGYRELDMIGALKSVHSTPDTRPSETNAPREASVEGHAFLSSLGRQIARLPLNPAFARILLAAHHEKALADTLIVVAALECDDPRRRPIEKQAEADKLHSRFLSPVSDFAAYIRLWRWYRDQTAKTSQSATRRLCKDNFLSYPRMRDWSDLRDQLERLSKDLELDVGSSSGGDMGLHRALLTGLIGNLGKRDPETQDYLGARGIRFALFPGSGLAKLKAPKPPAPRHGKPTPHQVPLSRDWIVAGELVETSRLFARTAACIDPEWIEPIAKPFCKSSYHSPSWDPRHGFVRVKERVTLFGLVLVAGRTRDYSRINLPEAREIFLREGLIAGAFPAPLPHFLVSNLKRIRHLLEAEEKTRQHGALFDPEVAYTFYATHIPTSVCNAAALRQWLAKQSPEQCTALEMREQDLPPLHDLSKDFPNFISLGKERLPLSYRHAPGEPDDGVTCTLPVSLLSLVATWKSDWLVPGMLDEKLRWMLSMLPAKERRLLQPIDETLTMCRSYLTPGKGHLFDALSHALHTARGIKVFPTFWREDALPNHLRMRFAVVDESGTLLAADRMLASLIKQFNIENASSIAAHTTSPWQREGLTQWDFNTLPPQVDIGKAGWPIINYPALVDMGESCALRLFADANQAAAAHEKGVCRLYALALGKEGRRFSKAPALTRDLSGYLKQLEMTSASLGEAIGRAALREAFIEEQPVIRDAETFKTRLSLGQSRLSALHAERTRLVIAILHAANEIERLLGTTPLQQATREDLLEQLAWLVFPDFAESINSSQLQHLPRYLEACRIRIQRAQSNPVSDQRKISEVNPHWQRYLNLLTAKPQPFHNAQQVQHYRWMVEELRVSLFAQELKTPLPVSTKRLNTLWDQALS